MQRVIPSSTYLLTYLLTHSLTHDPPQHLQASVGAVPGRLVSALCVEQIAATSWNNRRELAETHVASLNATVLAQDFTFDICKRIFVKDPDTNAQINPYNGLSIVMNENSQVVWCVFSLPRELFIDCSRGLRNAAPSKTP